MPTTDVNLDAWAVIAPEAGGADEGKIWVAKQSDAGRTDHWLWKPRQQTDDGSVLALSDVAEVVASRVARRMGLPAAECVYATRGIRFGVISSNVAPSGYDLHDGETFLHEVEGYTRRSPKVGSDGRPHGFLRLDTGYTLAAVKEVLDGLCGPPPSWDQLPAFDVFTGYLVLDALIANTDRHPKNWALIERRHDGVRYLAPTFDHGSALGAGLTDAKRAARDPEAFAKKGQASAFSPRHQTLVKLAHEAVRMAGNETWLASVDSLTDSDFEATMESPVGKMSDVAARFMMKVMQVNRRRLRHVDDGQD